jgi:hypothetical protein
MLSTFRSRLSTLRFQGLRHGLSAAPIGIRSLAITILLLAGGEMAAPAQEAGADRATVEREVMAVLDAFMTAFNAMDMEAFERTLHFPHFRLAGAGMTVLEAPGGRDGAELRRRLEATGWHHSAWERREIVHLGADKVHVDTLFVRYRADGSVLSRFESLYVLTREQGRWGIRLRSSFAP